MSDPDDDGLAEEEIRLLVRRLARRHASGGHVVERAAIVAEGPRATAILRWITDRDGKPEFAGVPESSRGGLHGDRGGTRPASTTPLRYVLPPGALG